MSLNMTRAEREAFLAGVHVGVISIGVADGAPLSAPIWYDYDPQIGISVLTEPGSKKGVALERAGCFTIVAQSEELPYKYVSVSGPIRSVRKADKEKDSRPMARRYFGVKLGDAYTDGNAGSSNVYVMQPETWLTLDYAKLGSFG
jgi:nitroimidazol reductase NimA-like FMN-containing flavoprotein (pyridoxamine 5'-phosphate oxidase superfamily)